MHRLRIEFRGKRKHFLARDAARSETAEMAWWKIFEGQHHDGDCREGGPIVAVIYGNLNPPTRMARVQPASIAVRCSPCLPRTAFGARACAGARFTRTHIRLAGRTTDV